MDTHAKVVSCEIGNVEKEKSSIPLSIVCIGVILGGSMLMGNGPIVKCSSSSKISDILSINYNEATVKLENGQLITVKKDKLKKGDNYCLTYSRE